MFISFPLKVMEKEEASAAAADSAPLSSSPKGVSVEKINPGSSLTRCDSSILYDLLCFFYALPYRSGNEPFAAQLFPVSRRKQLFSSLDCLLQFGRKSL